MDLPLEIIMPLVIAAASIPSALIEWRRQKDNNNNKLQLESLEAEREKEKLESETRHQQLENELAEIRKEQSLMDIFAKVVDGLGRMDRCIRETAQQTTSALNAQTEAQTNLRTNVGSLETRLNDFLLELRGNVLEFNTSQENHTMSAGERHKALIDHLTEIKGLLTPPPTPTLLKSPKKLQAKPSESSSEKQSEEEKEEKFG